MCEGYDEFYLCILFLIDTALHTMYICVDFNFAFFPSCFQNAFYEISNQICSLIR